MTLRRPSLTALLATALLLLIGGLRPIAAQGRDCDGYFTPMVVPEGLCVRRLLDSVGPVHQIVVHPSGVLVMATDSAPGLLRFTDGRHTGKASPPVAFGPGIGGTGLTWRAGWLYFAADSGVVRYRWPADASEPDPQPEWIDRSLPVSDAAGAHNARGIAVGADGMVYVSIGTVSDNCQVKFEAHAVGRWPCTELDRRGGIWRYAPPLTSGGAWTNSRYATGIRNAEALALDGATGSLWAVTHGREHLAALWEWSDSTAAMQPADMLEQVTENADFGWPYCQGLWDRTRTRLMVAPEYAKQPAVNCASRQQPLLGFPARWAPAAAAVVNSTANPLPHPGLYIAFPGVDSVAQYVVYVPFDANGQPDSSFRVVVHGTGQNGAFRPSGIAVTLDGTMYVTDGTHGRVYRVEPRVAPVH